MDLTELKHLNLETKSRHPWEIARLNVIIRLLKSAVRRTKKSDLTLFDIGCGDTFLATHICTIFPGNEIHAVDPAFTEEHMKEIRKLTGSTGIFLYDNIEKISLRTGKKADIVLLLDVIEHIEDDAGFLSALMKNHLITQETVFIIAAPAFQCLFSAHDKFLNHYRRYSRKSLLHTLKNSNLKSMQSGYFFFVLLFPRIVQLLFEKMKLTKSADKGIGEWNHGAVISRVLYAALMIDNFICRILSVAGISIPGLSVYAVCRPAV